MVFHMYNGCCGFQKGKQVCMKFDGIKKINEGKFISRYDLYYTTADDRKKTYEIISRNNNITTEEQIRNPGPDGVVIIATDRSGMRILLNREFRLSVDAYIYNFPAGLIDEGETPEVAAARELREETGLSLIQIDDRLNDSYSAIGFANETNAVVIGKAAGTFARSSSTLEEIDARWYTRAEVRELLKTERFAARTQAYCYLWSREEQA